MDNPEAFDKADMKSKYTFRSQDPNIKSRRQLAREDTNKRLLFEYQRLIQACDQLNLKESLTVEINGRKIKMSVVEDPSSPSLTTSGGHGLKVDGSRDRRHKNDFLSRLTPQGVLPKPPLSHTKQYLNSASDTILEAINENLNAIVAAIDNITTQLAERMEKTQIELFEKYKQPPKDNSLEGIDNAPKKHNRGDKQDETSSWQLTKIQIQPFSGEIWSWKPWFIIFEKIMEGAGIKDKRDKLLRFVTSLVGDASVYFGNLSHRVQNDYDLLVEAMRLRFGPDLGEDCAQFELRTMVQHPGEPLEMWGDRVMSIASEAYPNLIGAQEQQGAFILVRGCNDESSRVYALQEMRKMSKDQKKQFNVRKALELIKSHQRIKNVCLAEELRRNPTRTLHLADFWYGYEHQIGH